MPRPARRDSWNGRLHAPLPAGLRRWLLSRDSLTARLRAHTRAFRVKLLYQGLGRLLPDECTLLGVRPGTRAWIRDVLLCDGDRPLVYAHSVLPATAVHGAWNLFAGLGTRPLGEVLFTDPSVLRHALHYKTLSRRHPLFRRLAAHAATARLEARRSLFHRRARGLLVTEVFLDPGALT
ncbi:MAG: chorismate lyase [Betaproteobacteria bacterium]|nr:chorismate lyase [Betaproteobacteria bacterium]